MHLGIYDVTGQQVATLVQGWRTAGVHTITWDGRDSAGEQVASGVYLYRLAIGRKSQVRRLLLLK